MESREEPARARICGCRELHRARRVVVTGGPGAGKTAVLELVKRSLCAHVVVLPEAAGIVFGGGFPRRTSPPARRAAQRAIFHVQRELEATVEGADAALVLCDRGTIDGAAYWPGPGELFGEIGTTLSSELARYDVVIHLRTPPTWEGYNRANPLRVESAEEAHVIDERIAAAWAEHPRRFEIAPAGDFLRKASQALELIRREVPACCSARAA